MLIDVNVVMVSPHTQKTLTAIIACLYFYPLFVVYLDSLSSVKHRQTGKSSMSFNVKKTAREENKTVSISQFLSKDRTGLSSASCTEI